ncbi:Histone-lysine N-methyltransferase SMYD3 [Armadillidium vulgare]|nr:Histone-lysine N-methyltransferase SMYD3 [Armadillidium vulgare]
MSTEKLPIQNAEANENLSHCDKEAQTLSQTDEDSLAQLLSTSDQSFCSLSKQSPYSSERDSKSSDEQKVESVKPYASNVEDTTAKTRSFDAYQKELCEKILKTDPLLSIRDSKIYFTQFQSNFCNKLEELNSTNIKNEFLKINNDYDRIRYILQFEKFVNLKFSIAKHNYKSEKFASALESESKNYCKAPADILIHGLKLINRSIQFTPGEDRKSLGIRLMKRAWINIMLLRFDEAREDAHRSLQYHFDPSIMWNSYEVLGHCYAKIGKNNTAEGFFSHALCRLKQSNLDQKRKTVTETRINSIFKRIKGRKDIGGPAKNITEILTTPQVSYGVNKTLICATDAVEVKINEKTDIGLYATKDIDPGDVIIVEKPYVSALYRENIETRCINCFKRFKSSIPCDTCTRVWFCSEECLKEAKAGFHSSECKVLHLLYEKNIGRMAPLVFRILLRLTWENIKLFRKSRKIDTRLPDSHPLHMNFDFEEKYSTDDYLKTYKLVTNAQKRNFGDLFERTLIAVYLNHCLKEVDFYKGNNVSSDDEIFVASLILRHLQNSSCNALNNVEFFVKDNLDIIAVHYLGISIYPTISLINNSCNPNVFKYYVGKDSVVRATNIIRKGEQLLDNYSHSYETMRRESRRNILKNQYMFHCECIACEENWPIFEDNKVYMKLACPEEQCNQIVEFDGKGKMNCPSCVCSSSKQSPYSSQKKSKSSNKLKDASNLGDTTPNASFDEASQKELCEKILKTDPLKSIKDSQIYFTQFEKNFHKKLRNLKPERNIENEFSRIKGRKDIGGPIKNITEVLTAPQVSYGVNKTLICATDAVEVKINEKTGRGLYATKDIYPGDVIMVDKPYVSGLCRENFETHCINCFKRFKSPIPCNTCSRVWFCSEECLKDTNAGFHSSECRVLHLLYENEICKDSFTGDMGKNQNN